MHSFLITLVSLFVSFCHHSTPLTQAQAETAWRSQPVLRSPVLSFPNRHQLAQADNSAVYAERECLSCPPMSPSLIAR